MTTPTFISLFAGIGGFDRGLEEAGFSCLGQVELDDYCQAVLAKNFPEVPKHDDVRTAIDWYREIGSPKVDLVCGGFPCQDVSVAGKRAGLHNDDGERTRTGLFFDALDFIREAQPTVVLLENVPGLLTSNEGRDFGVIVNSLVESGYPHVEWRVLDSRYFGVPQRRRRVFIVASSRDPHGSAILPFVQGSSGHSSARTPKGSGVAPRVEPSVAGRGGLSPAFDPVGPLMAGGGTDRGYRLGVEEVGAGHVIPVLSNPTDGVARALVAGGNDKHDVTRMNYVVQPVTITGPITHTLKADGFDGSEDGTGRGQPMVPLIGVPDPAGTITKRIGKGVNSTLDDGAVAFHMTQDPISGDEFTPALSNGNKHGCATIGVRAKGKVRRLTPTECERLQGFPDGWTIVPNRKRKKNG